MGKVDAELMDKLRRLILGESKLVTYKNACSYLDMHVSQTKEVLRQFAEAEKDKLDTAWMLKGEDKETSKLRFKVVPQAKVEETRASLKSVQCEHIYSVCKKPEVAKEETYEEFSERHYVEDKRILQNVWFDRVNFMSDQIMLDHRYSTIRGIPHTRKKVKRPQNLCSPDRKRKAKKEDKWDPFARKPKKPEPKPAEKAPEPINEGSKKRKSTDSKDKEPPKKKAKTNSVMSMFGKAKKAKEEPEKKEEPAKPKPPAKKKGLFGFFKKSAKPSNPFDAMKKEASKPKKAPMFGKRKTEAAKKPSKAKKKAVKATKAKTAAKPKGSIAQTKPPAPVTEKDKLDDVFADESEDEDKMPNFDEEEEEEEEEEEMEIMRKQKKTKEEEIVRENQFADEENEDPAKENMDADSDSDDGFNPEGKPTKLTKKERRAKLKAEEAARRKEKLASRKKNFWGTGMKKMAPKKKKRTKIIQHSYVDEATGMLVTEDKEVPVSDDENNKEEIAPGGGSQDPAAVAGN